jgi:hypothetical protein
MGIFLATAAGAAILFSIVWVTQKEKKKRVLLKENIPENLGLLQGVPAEKVKLKLEQSLSYEYLNQVKLRYLSEHPQITEDEFEWRAFELKRYYLLNSILKNTPMFSADVDEVWHEMIMFTKQYEAFSDKYLGRMLHHTPNLNPEPAPQERALFDWIFAQLFEITEYTWKAWGGFFQYPLDQDLLKNMKSLSEDEIRQRYFAVNENNQELISYLIQTLKRQLRESEKMYSMHQKGKFDRPGRYGDLSPLTMVMVFYSYFYFDEYWMYAKEYAYAQQAQGTSGCSAVFCGSGGIHDSNDGKGCSSGNNCSGHSCSSSSCSSCGGGCSS